MTAADDVFIGLGNGKDKISITNASAGDILLVNLGAGNDLLDLMGSGEAVLLDALDGNDSVFLDVSATNPARFSNILFGPGNDSFFVRGGTFAGTVSLDGDVGTDQLQIENDVVFQILPNVVNVESQSNVANVLAATKVNKLFDQLGGLRDGLVDVIGGLV